MVAAAAPAPSLSPAARQLVVRVVGALWRSAAGEWLLWFALGGGPPDF
ncbi:hypothetical protein [Pseudarthrobacter sp. NamE2]|nr:hypothetical protein [Pseudarthrobacter sp. NamE2]